MKISVIIPCFNEVAVIGDQLQALAKQDFKEAWEVIVADNGSTDGTVEVVESYRDRLPALRLVNAAERRGPAYARNRGAREARADRLAFCDADDQADPGYVRAMCDALERHVFVACRYKFEKLNHHCMARYHGGCQTDGIDGGLLGPYAYAGGGSLGVRKAAHDLIGGFDEDFPALEDTDYCVRMQRAGIPIVFAPKALIHVRWPDSVRESFQQARRWGRSFVAVRLRHWPTESPPDTFASLGRYLLQLRRVRNADQLAKWIWSAGWQLGSAEGWRRQRQPLAPGSSPPIQENPYGISFTAERGQTPLSPARVFRNLSRTRRAGSAAVKRAASPATQTAFAQSCSPPNKPNHHDTDRRSTQTT